MRPVALVPGVPALLPEYAGIEDPVADLRAACRAAVGLLGPRVLVVAPRGASGGAGARVARHLVAEAGASVCAEGDATGVLVVGNGSAKRTLKAPGHFDERAEAFDEALRAALLAPDPAALAAIDPTLAEDLWADVDGIRALGRLLDERALPTVHCDAAPFGVQYWVLTWTDVEELTDRDA